MPPSVENFIPAGNRHFNKNLRTVFLLNYILIQFNNEPFFMFLFSS
jgi:hypothetical protein